MFQKKVKLAQTYEGFVQQANDFLASQGFPTDHGHRQMFGTFIQHFGQSQDYFEPKALAATMRKSIANGHAFDLIQASIKAQKEEAKKKQEEDEQAKAATATVG